MDGLEAVANGGTRWNKQEVEDKVRNKEQIRGLRVIVVSNLLNISTKG
jgi:hypothetical protein